MAKTGISGRSGPDDAEHVDVCVVGGEVNEDHSGPSVQPQVVHQIFQYGGALLFGATQVLIVTCSAVCCQQAPVRGALDLLVGVVGPTAERTKTELMEVIYPHTQTNSVP